jgi:hypothetical protein
MSQFGTAAFDGTGVEAGIAHHLHAFGRDMDNKLGDAAGESKAEPVTVCFTPVAVSMYQ